MLSMTTKRMWTTQIPRACAGEPQLSSRPQEAQVLSEAATTPPWRAITPVNMRISRMTVNISTTKKTMPTQGT